MAFEWTQPSGYSLGIKNEGEHFDDLLPVSDDTDVTYKVISGKMPVGVFLKGNRIAGTPLATGNSIDYLFCIRATHNNGISDRSFTLSLDPDTIEAPQFITPEGALAVGPRHQFYILDGSFVSYQIEAIDLNPEIGVNLSYFIESGGGDLPPGLTISDAGLISGYIDPNISPTTLKPPYEFNVTISDGINFSTQSFSILVVGPDQFRADSTINDAVAGTFSVDVSYLRQPLWLTESDLGLYRANNYITVPLALYDNKSTTFRLETTNIEGYAVVQQYTTRVGDEFVTDNDDNKIGRYTLSVSNTTGISYTTWVGKYITFKNYVTGASDIVYKILAVEQRAGNHSFYKITLDMPLELTIDNGVPFYFGTLSVLPDGTAFDEVTSQVYGVVPYQPVITKSYTFTVFASRYDYLTSERIIIPRTFTISILGDITSKITWATDSDLGLLHANYISTLQVNANSNVSNAIVNYYQVGGSIPPGLTLTSDGEIVGSVNQYYDETTGVLGLTTFSQDGISDLTFDNGTTTFDRQFTFEVEAGDQFGYSAASRNFTVQIDTPNTTSFSNISVRPFLPPVQRSAWRSFITNTDIFTASSIYRPNDPAFGLRQDLSMLIFAGIETTEIANYVASIGSLINKKRFHFNSFKSAMAVDPASGKDLYEVVYAQLVDPLNVNGKNLPAELDINNVTYHPNSVNNWRAIIEQTMVDSDQLQHERNYLPLWMRTIQPGSKSETNYVTAVPLCYCQVGTAADILLNIKASGFDFKVLDYTVDRFIIDAADRIIGDKYLAFNQDRTTV